MTGCAPAVGPPSLAREILASTDCLITEKIQLGYSALLTPGGTFSQMVTLALTIYVAIFGYRLLLGYSSLTLGEVVPHFLKIGLVLALATNWHAYQAVVFDLLFKGPGDLANGIVRHLTDGQARQAEDVIAALQGIFDLLTDSAADSWAQVRSLPGATLPAGVLPADAPPVASMPEGSMSEGAMPATLPFQMGAPQFVAAALWLSALVMMAATVGLLLAVRIVLALLLLVGPLFIACALFSGTRGLFEGWLRTTLKFALVPLLTLPLAAAMVMVLLPLTEGLADAPNDSFRDGPALAILVVTCVFAAVLFQAVRLTGGIAGGLRLPRGSGVAPVSTAAPSAHLPSVAPGTQASHSEIGIESRDARPVRPGGNPATGILVSRMVSPAVAQTSANIASSSRLGQSYRRQALADRAVSVRA